MILSPPNRPPEIAKGSLGRQESPITLPATKKNPYYTWWVYYTDKSEYFKLLGKQQLMAKNIFDTSQISSIYTLISIWSSLKLKKEKRSFSSPLYKLYQKPMGHLKTVKQ